MTIQDDDDPSERQDVRRNAEQSARRFAAAIAGAIEGFVQAMDDHDVTETTKASLATAGEIAREAGAEVKDVAQTPEMREVGQAVGRATQRVTDTMETAATHARDTAHDARANISARADDVKDRARRVKEGAKVRAEAVGEAGRRAAAAPRRIGHELRAALGSWWGALKTGLAMALAIGVLAIVTLVVLTIALVVGLDQVFGDPRGTWLTAGLYTVLVGIAYGIMTSRRKAAALRTQRHLENSKAEARHVVAPVRSAFSGKGRTGF